MARGETDRHFSFLRLFAPATIAALFFAGLLPYRTEKHLDSLSTVNEFDVLDLVQMVSPEDYTVLTSVDWSSQNDFLSAGM